MQVLRFCSPWHTTNVTLIKASNEPRVNEVKMFALRGKERRIAGL